MMETENLLSVVAASRNDGHGVHAEQRTQIFIGGLAEQAERFRRHVELVLVEWNPPDETPPLADVLSVPENDWFTARVVTVPTQVHRELGGPARLRFYQMIAKNVGIRRARGEAVLATNIDILLSDDLFLKCTGELSDSCLYRADRYDVPFDPAVSKDPAELRTSSPIRIHRRNGIEHPGRGVTDPHIVGAGSLVSQFLTKPGRFAQKIFAPNAHTGPPGLPRLRRGFRKVFVLPSIHGNACGDFTLMTRAGWDGLFGYPEWVLHSWNLDSLFLYQAAAAGYTLVDWDGAPCVHLEHSGGWTPDAEEKLFKVLASDGITILPTADLLDVAYTMWRGRARGAWRTNLGGWGLADLELAENRPRTIHTNPVDR